MKLKRIDLILCLALFCGLAEPAQAEMWADYFDGIALDAAKWTVGTGNPKVSGGLLNFTGAQVLSKNSWVSGIITFTITDFGNNVTIGLQNTASGHWYMIRNDMAQAVEARSSSNGSGILNTNWNPINVIGQIELGPKRAIFRMKDVGDTAWDSEATLPFTPGEFFKLSISSYGSVISKLDSVTVEPYPTFDDINYLSLFAENWLRSDCRAANGWCDVCDRNGSGAANFADFAEVAGGRPFIPEIPAEITCLPSTQMLTVSVDAAPVLILGVFDSITVSLRDGNGAISQQTKPAGTTAQADFTFDFSTLSIGNYTIRIECYKSDGTTLKSSDKVWEKLDPNPDWKANPVAAERRVPTHFSPVNIETLAGGAIDVTMWGRTYSFNQSLYPTQIKSQEHNLLGSPVRLVGTINGTPLDASSAVVAVIENTTDRAVLSSDRTANGVFVHTQTTIEFDGMFLSTLTLTPNMTGKTIESLKLEIPFDPTKATLMHRNSCNPSSPMWSGDTPAVWSGQFYPVVWLGNETAGLCWFAESAKGWSNVSTDSRLKISTAGGCTVFTLNFIDQQIALNQPLTITFGFTATPTKPMP
jgi:hypothetical protein